MPFPQVLLPLKVQKMAPVICVTWLGMVGQQFEQTYFSSIASRMLPLRGREGIPQDNNQDMTVDKDIWAMLLQACWMVKQQQQYKL